MNLLGKYKATWYAGTPRKLTRDYSSAHFKKTINEPFLPNYLKSVLVRIQKRFDEDTSSRIGLLHASKGHN